MTLTKFKNCTLLLLTLTTVQISLVACGGGEQTATDTSSTSTETTSTTTDEVSQTETIPQPDETTFPPLNPEDIFAINPQQSQQQGNVQVEVVRVLVANKEIIDFNHPKLIGQDIQVLVNQSPEKNAVASAITLKITNNTDKNIIFLIDSWLVSVEGQQLNIDDSFWEGNISGDDFNSAILPDVTVFISVPFSLKNLTVPEIKNMNISLDSAYESKSDALYQITQPFFFQLDLSQHIFEPFPQEPKQVE